ncbi:MAG TPA: aminopeptidase P N-terminal domain-containing protein, partial [Bryobacteraceae bacterium]|nr:aminopeptidase P N-terminal domain-containing protein [Bryobacteraceae bacterium]
MKKTLWRAIFFAVTCGALMLAIAGTAMAQYTDWQAIDDLGGPKEFVARRAELAAQTKTGYTILFARNEIPESSHYREDNDFYYYTGVQDPGAVLVMDNVNGKAMLFEPQQVGRTAQVYGANLLSQPDAAKKLGFDSVQPVGNLDIMLSYMAGGRSGVDLWVRLGFPDKADGARPEVGRDHAWKFAHPYHEDVTSDEAPVKLLAERYPMTKLQDVTNIIDGMRNIKRPGEIEVLRRNGKISAEGNREAMAHVKPGMHQYEIEARAYEYYYSHGAQGMAYLAIVGSGKDINTWHYFSNRNVIEANQLVVF